jgi:hypothetical protein
MSRKIDLTGKVFGRLTVTKYIESRWLAGKFRRYHECLCNCGKITEVTTDQLRSGSTQSCGCLRKDISTKHGDADNSYIYATWMGAKRRCLDKNRYNYRYYGGRGISFYHEWVDDYPSFKQWIQENLGDRPSDYSLDRIDNNGNYEPGNLRWASRSEQQLNRSCSKRNKLRTSL